MPSAPFWDPNLLPTDAILFVLGTDTSVGKTRLVEELIRSSQDPNVLRVIKAVQTGPPEDHDIIRYIDAGASIDQIWEGYSFPSPLDPMTAARLEGVSIDPQRLIHKIESSYEENRRVIVEGSGGILSPFFEDGSGILALISRLRYPVAIYLVSHPHLGTLSVTLSAIRILKEASLPMTALVLCPRPGVWDEASRYNPDTLKALIDPYPVLHLSP